MDGQAATAVTLHLSQEYTWQHPAGRHLRSHNTKGHHGRTMLQQQGVLPRFADDIYIFG